MLLLFASFGDLLRRDWTTNAKATGASQLLEQESQRELAVCRLKRTIILEIGIVHAAWGLPFYQGYRPDIGPFVISQPA